MTRKMKRTLSLILALVMLCSTMGVMAFAQTRASLYAKCYSEQCGGNSRHFTRHYAEGLNRVIVCPLHNELHDTEEWSLSEWYTCDTCGWMGYNSFEIEYRCLI